MALVPPSDDRATRNLGRFDSVGLDDLAFVIGGAIVVMTLVRFQPKVGGWLLLAVTLLLLNQLFMGRGTL